MNDMTTQRAALHEARLFRADHLMAVHEGLLEPLDVVDAAHEPAAQALRKIRLDHLFVAAQGTSTREWRLIRKRTLGVLCLDVPDRDLTIGWVIDPRAGGRRLHALKDALRPRLQMPWRGFPWAEQ